MSRLFATFLALTFFAAEPVYANCGETYARAIGYYEGRIQNQNENNSNYASLTLTSAFVAYLMKGRPRVGGLALSAASGVLWIVGEYNKSEDVNSKMQMEDLSRLMKRSANPDPEDFFLGTQINELAKEVGLAPTEENSTKVFDTLMKGFANDSLCPNGRALPRSEILAILKQKLNAPDVKK